MLRMSLLMAMLGSLWQESPTPPAKGTPSREQEDDSALRREVASCRLQIQTFRDLIDLQTHRIDDLDHHLSKRFGERPEQHRGWKVTGTVEKLGLIVFSAGKEGDIALGDALGIFRESQYVARIQVDRVEEGWSSGRIVFKKDSPRVFDEVSRSLPRSETSNTRSETIRPILDCIFSFRPLTEEDDKAFAGMIADLDSDDAAVRTRASRALVGRGGPARAALSQLDLARLSPEARERVRDAIEELDGSAKALKIPGPEHDVAFLSTLSDPRAYLRLRSMLSGVRPFSTAGFPEEGPGYAEYLQGWWSYSKERVRWAPREDRFVDK